MKKKIFSLIFISFVMILSLVGGTLFLSADSVFSASTDIADADGSDHEVAAQASGNWADLWSGSRRGQLSYNRGTVYIYDEYDLMDFMCQVNDTTATWWTTSGDGGAKIAECSIELEADIDMSAHYWTPIGTGARQFNGTFDGNGHTISGLYISKNASDLGNYTVAYEGIYGIGLFGVVGSCTISDLTLSGGYFSIYTNTTTSIRMGGFVGMAINDSTLYLRRVVNNMSYVEIYGSYATNSANGGLVGCNYRGSIRDSYNFADVEGVSKVSLGGIAGTTDYYCDMYRCGNFGEIRGRMNTETSSGFGGIVGAINEGDSWTWLEDCVNYGFVNITSSSTSFQSNCVGGIIGLGFNKVYLNRCINYGEVKGTSCVGGIAGKMGNEQSTLSIPPIWYIPWWKLTFKISAARESVAIVNCLNFGEVQGSNTWGKICGEMNGQENIQACYTVNKEHRVGKWLYADGKETKNFSYTFRNIDYWSGSTAYQFSAAFYRDGSGHTYNYSGSMHDRSFSAWNSSSVYLNGGSSTGWTITTLIYDYYGGSDFGLSSSYPYSLVPSSLIGNAYLTTRYYRGSSIEYDFDGDEDDQAVVKVAFNWVESNGTVTEHVLGHRNARFYFIKGLENSVRDTLKVYYHTDNFTFSSASAVGASTMGARNVSSSYRTNSVGDFNRIQRLYFTMGTHDCYYPSEEYFKIILQSKTAQPIKSTEFKIGMVKMSVLGSNAASYSWSSAKKISSGSDYTKFFTIDKSTSTSYYYKEAVTYNITPKYGYSILYVLNKKKTGSPAEKSDNYGFENGSAVSPSSGTITDTRSISSNQPKYTLTSDEVTAIAPYSTKDSQGYGIATVGDNNKYKMTYSRTATIYVVPTWYAGINLIFVDSDSSSSESNSPKRNEIPKSFWTYLGASYGSSPSGTRKGKEDSRSGVSSDSFSSNPAKLVIKNASSSSDLINYDGSSYNFESEYVKFGYTYDAYAFMPNSSEVGWWDDNDTPISNYTKSYRKITLSGNQPNKNKAIELNLRDIVEKGVKGSNGSDEEARKNNRELFVVFVRTKIEYTINYVTMATSYDDNKYQIYRDGRTGGVVGAEKNIKVGQSIAFENNIFPGYEFKGTDFVSNESGVNTNRGLSNNNYSFETLLNSYLGAVCGNDVNDTNISNRTLTIYVYYQLKTYNLNVGVKVDGAELKNKRDVTIDINNESLSNTSTSATTTKKIYYFTPIKMEAKTNASAHFNFLGWFVTAGGGRELLLSVDPTYNFLVIPSVVGAGKESNQTHIDGGYTLSVVAKYMEYDYSTASVPNAGSGKVLKIRTANDLVALSSRVRNGESYEDTLIQLENDIDMSSKVFAPIGTEEHPFKGIFDGQNHIISNLVFIKNNSAFYGYKQNLRNVGLFGYTNGATIRNLTIMDSDFTGFSHTGIFVANATNTTMSFLNNYNCNLELSAVQLYDIYGGKISGRIDYTTRGSEDKSITKPAELSGVSSWMNVDADDFQRASIGGLVGEMSGMSSVYACSVNAGISRTDVLSGAVNYKIEINALVGKNNAGTIDQSCVENSKNEQFSLTDDTLNVTNCYYRSYSGTTSHTTYYIKNNVSSTPTVVNDVWFKLANGLWALKVLYWH